MSDLFKFDRSVFVDVDDKRVQMLLDSSLSQLEFIKLMKNSDPWVISNGELKLLTEKDIQAGKDSFAKFRRGVIQKTGGITPDLIKTYKDLIISVYPEMTIHYDNTEKEISESGCPECAINGKYAKLVETLVSLKPDGRDLSKLSILGDTPLKKLRGEEIDPSTIVIEYPEGVERSLPKMKTGNSKSAPAGVVTGIFQRPSCKLCVVKHLAYAFECLKEVAAGYTLERGHDHFALAVASLEHAEQEALKDDANLAEKIRDFRNRLESKVSWK